MAARTVGADAWGSGGGEGRHGRVGGRGGYGAFLENPRRRLGAGGLPVGDADRGVGGERPGPACHGIGSLRLYRRAHGVVHGHSTELPVLHERRGGEMIMHALRVG